MQCRLTRIDPLGAAKTLAACYALFGLVGGCIRYAYASSAPDLAASPADILMQTFAFALAGFLGTLLAVVAFNVSASWSGGIDIRLDSLGAAKSGDSTS